MTREEAIESLNEINETIFGGGLKSIPMAIKSLEQEPILDKIRAEIIEKFENCSICEWFEDYDYEENDISEYQSVGDISDIIDIIDKYKAESEEKE